MPLFKRKPAEPPPPEGDSPPEIDERLCGTDEIRATLSRHVERAASAGASFCLLCVVPQLLPGQRIPAAEARIVADAIVDQLRDDDRAGELADTGYLVILPNATPDQAQVVAHRLATEFTVRSAHVNRRNWRVGIAVFPDDGMAPETLIQAALSAAKRGNRAA